MVKAKVNAPAPAPAPALINGFISLNPGVTNVAPPAAPPAPTIAVKGINTRGVNYPPNYVFTYVKPNPKVPGTAGYNRYALFTVGSSVASYLANPLVTGYANVDIRYNLAKGFIKIGPPAK